MQNENDKKKLKPLEVLKEFKIWIKFFDVIKIYKENTLYVVR